MKHIKGLKLVQSTSLPVEGFNKIPRCLESNYKIG